MRDILLKVFVHILFIAIFIPASSRSSMAADDFARQDTITMEFDCVAAYVKYNIDFDWSENETCAGKNNLLPARQPRRKEQREKIVGRSPEILQPDQIAMLSEDRSDDNIVAVEMIEKIPELVLAEEEPTGDLPVQENVPAEKIVPADNIPDEVTESAIVRPLPRKKKRVRRRFFFLI